VARADQAIQHVTPQGGPLHERGHAIAELTPRRVARYNPNGPS
jgi:hypothetical protein